METTTSTIQSWRRRWKLTLRRYILFLTTAFVLLSYNNSYAPTLSLLFGSSRTIEQGPNDYYYYSNIIIIFVLSVFYFKNFKIYHARSQTPFPALGQSITDVVTFDASVEASTNGSNGTYIPYTFNGSFTFNVNHTQDVGNTEYYDLEIVTLDMTGGNLPPGWRFRTSPSSTSNSVGTFTAEDLQYGFLLSSTLDLYLEFSQDGGNTWSDATGNPPVHMELEGDPVPSNIPAAGTWGKLIMIGCVLFSGAWFLFRARG